MIECNKKYTIIYKIDQHTTEEESSHDRIETPIPLNKITLLSWDKNFSTSDTISI